MIIWKLTKLLIALFCGAITIGSAGYYVGIQPNGVVNVFMICAMIVVAALTHAIITSAEEKMNLFKN